nr:hypothetical protein [Synechococcus sp. WH 8101]
MSKQDPQDLCGACVSNHQPDHLGRRIPQQAHPTKVIVFGNDCVALVGRKQPDLLIALALQLYIPNMHAAREYILQGRGKSRAQIFIQQEATLHSIA